jgi:hypothetical protein
MERLFSGIHSSICLLNNSRCDHNYSFKMSEQLAPIQRRSSSRLSLSDDDIDDSNFSDDEAGEQRTVVLHQLQVQSARKFLWDENDDEDCDGVAVLSLGNSFGSLHSNHGSSSNFVSPHATCSSFVWNSQEEIDLEGRFGASRQKFVETQNQKSFFQRSLFTARGKSDRLGRYSAYQKFLNVRLCIQGSIMFVLRCMFGARKTKRNACIFTCVALVIAGIIFAIRSKGNDTLFLRKHTPTNAPSSSTINAPSEPVLSFPITQPQVTSQPTTANPKSKEHNVVGISDGESVIDTTVAAFQDLLKKQGNIDENLMNDQNSPQYKALHWVAKVDPSRIAHSSHTFVFERYSLATIFFAMSGADLFRPGDSVPVTTWKDQSQWMSGAGYCAWYGVHCITGDNSSTNSEIISLNLTANGLKGQLPPEVHLLSHLDHLDLSHNEISENIPTEMGLLTSLRTLFLGENQMTGPIPTEIGEMNSLRNVDFSGNDFKDQIPSEISRCSSLRTLILDMNPRITGHLPPLAGLKELEVLSVKHNKLDGTIPDWVYDLTNLRQLRFQRNAFSGTVSPNLSNLSNLRMLHNLDSTI